MRTHLRPHNIMFSSRSNTTRFFPAALAIPLLVTSAFILAACESGDTEAPSQADQPTVSELSGSAVSDILERNELVVGVDIPYGVMEFLDEEGSPSGIDIDIAKAIANDLGVPIAFETMPFADLFPAVQAGDIDLVLSAVTITPERQETMLFSAPYIDAGMMIAVRADESEIEGIGSLSGKRVGVLEGTVGQDLANDTPSIDADQIVVFSANDERVEALLQGDIDAIIVHFLAQGHPGLKFVGEPLDQSFYGVVARLGADDLMARVDETLRELKRDGSLAGIRSRYVDDTPEE